MCPSAPPPIPPTWSLESALVFIDKMVRRQLCIITWGERVLK